MKNPADRTAPSSSTPPDERPKDQEALSKYKASRKAGGVSFASEIPDEEPWLPLFSMDENAA